ncbi:MAG: VCBS repeat-containing protein, partial [Verrucomicrobiae bacterium]|nr:VCBS repeat-containing protein [Verrucomicrobiae bacterium]
MTPRRLPSITPLLLLGALCAFVLETQAQSPGDAAFQRLDKNQDGKISRDEAPSADSFTAADADKNGAVTPEEFRRYLTARQRPQTPNPAPAPSATTQAQTPPPVDGKPVLKSLPDSDAVRDAAGTGQLFECVHLPGITDHRAGMNGFAIVDLNRDGWPDVVSTTTPMDAVPGKPFRDTLRVLINEGGFRFREERIEIRGSDISQEVFGQWSQIPNLVDLNQDGFLDLLVTRSSQNRNRQETGGNTLLLSDGAWDRFVDASGTLGLRNETAYNRQTSFGDVNGDGWLDVAIGCDNIKNAMGGVPHSRLYVFKPNGPKFEDGGFEDIGGSDLVPDFGGFYNDKARDKAGLRDLDNDG